MDQCQRGYWTQFEMHLLFLLELICKKIKIFIANFLQQVRTQFSNVTYGTFFHQYIWISVYIQSKWENSKKITTETCISINCKKMKKKLHDLPTFFSMYSFIIFFSLFLLYWHRFLFFFSHCLWYFVSLCLYSYFELAFSLVLLSLCLWALFFVA